MDNFLVYSDCKHTLQSLQSKYARAKLLLSAGAQNLDDGTDTEPFRLRADHYAETEIFLGSIPGARVPHARWPPLEPPLSAIAGFEAWDANSMPATHASAKLVSCHLLVYPNKSGLVLLVLLEASTASTRRRSIFLPPMVWKAKISSPGRFPEPDIITWDDVTNSVLVIGKPHTEQLKVACSPLHPP